VSEIIRLNDLDGDNIVVEKSFGDSKHEGWVFLKTTKSGSYVSPRDIPFFCRAIYTAAGLAWPPVIPDPLDPVRTSLRELANDPGLCTTERARAQRALDALS